jgi:hypothetical protein
MAIIGLAAHRRRLQAELTRYRGVLDGIRLSSMQTEQVAQMGRLMEEATRTRRETLNAMRLVDEVTKPTKEVLEIGRLMEEAAKPRQEMLRIVGLMEELRRPAAEMQRITRSMEEATKPVQETLQAMRLMENSVRQTMFRSLGALTDTTSLLASQLAAVSRAQITGHTIRDWAYAVQANNVALSAAAHLATSRTLSSSLLSGQATRSLGWLTLSYRHSLEGLRATTPAGSLAASVATARYALFADHLGTGAPMAPLASGMVAPDTAVSTRLDVRLSEIGEKLVRARRGAWAAIRSENPDKARQAAHSMRELLREVLDQLAPDNVFSGAQISHEGHEGRVTRRMRIHHIAHKGLAEFATVVDGALAGSYRILSKRAHGSHDDVEVLESIMAITEGLIALLLAARRTS